MQCLYEAQERVNCESALGPSVSFHYTISNSVLDWFSVGYLVTVGTCSWKLTLRGAEEFQMLVCGLRAKEEVCGSIEILELCYHECGEEIVVNLAKMPRKVLQQITLLDVSNCGLDSTEFDQLADIIPIMDGLKQLSIGNNPTGNGGRVKLLHTLTVTNHLHILNITNIHRPG